MTKHWTAKNRRYLSANSQQSFIKLSGRLALLSHHCCSFQFIFFFNPFLSEKIRRPDLQLGVT